MRVGVRVRDRAFGRGGLPLLDDRLGARHHLVRVRVRVKVRVRVRVRVRVSYPHPSPSAP